MVMIAPTSAIKGQVSMREANYHIIEHEKGWGILHDGSVSGEYLTKEAALEAAVGTASNAIKNGYGVTITVKGTEANEPALGAH
jgi:hypothetical protein